MEPEPELDNRVKVDLHGDDINVANVIKKLKDPKTLALRLHGSKDVQTMLKEIVQQMQKIEKDIEANPMGKEQEHIDDERTVRSQMHDLKDVYLVPVVVLTTGDQANNRACAKFILEAWNGALQAAGFPDQHVNENWYVSNHNFAVSLGSPDKEVQQADLPLGCEG
eukprot:COSAG06_NODE_10804_length_1613_cov_1.933289_1_plen_166_part_00